MSRSASKVRAEKSRAAPAPVLPPPPSPTHHVDRASIVPGHLTKSEWMDMVEQEEGEEVVAELLDELMCRVMEKCYQVYLQRQLVPFTVSWAQHSLVQTLEWQFLVRDDGDGQDHAPFWEQDSEPPPCEIDSWAQGCVPVVHSRPIPKNIPLQRSAELPLADAANPGSPQAKNISQSERKEDHSDWYPCKEDKNQNGCEGHAGLKPRMLIPCPPSKREDKKKHPLPNCPAIQAPQGRNSPCVSRGPISHSINMEEHPIPKEQTISVSKYKRAQKHSDLSAVKRLDAARLVRHQVLPGFEVLESHVSQLPIGKSSVPPIPHQKQDKHNTKLPAAVKPPTNSQMPHKVRRRSTVDGALWLSSRKRNIQDVGQSLGSMPLSAGLLLDTIVLSPGVTLKDPRKVHTNTYEMRLSQTGQRANLEPIRSSLPTPLFSKDQLMSG
ncbi:uncharacterized protein LOC118213330 isoform X1 [Anguilla anguilla]|uniref:uncharacterized protein LOC118213330 isoform X1 n=2 Tax=Anguilla anguilla TaxID=7936 RepID=UPI0015A85F2A|nr:uncharacterized protein LOC118213330 isoform X1 [Anguilla anguilla]XP_035248094.1 uncharacterized protein LOC118213330 isoform X1 [Anguilla anguilla]XP_035248095.1 uncharacterized protein LOC118213330 isoform X1 [Anguilla anguilla]